MTRASSRVIMYTRSRESVATPQTSRWRYPVGSCSHPSMTRNESSLVVAIFRAPHQIKSLAPLDDTHPSRAYNANAKGIHGESLLVRTKDWTASAVAERQATPR